jgi:beta-glucosidase
MRADAAESISALFGYPLTDPIPQIAANGTIISGGGSVSNAPAYINTPFDILQQRASDLNHGGGLREYVGSR